MTDRIMGVLDDLVNWFWVQMPDDEQQEMKVHLDETPNRLHKMYSTELLAGYQQDPVKVLGTVFPDSYSEMLVVRNIPVFSLCAHHLLPFHGIAHVAYSPQGKVVGLSKLARLVDCYARRLQIQERLTRQIAETLQKVLQPIGAACVIEAEHFCMGCRGVEKPGAETITSCLTGEFLEKPEVRAELFSLINHGRK